MTIENPDYLGSWRSLLTKISDIWLKGHSWLQVNENWPRQSDIKLFVESYREVKISKEQKSIIITTVKIQDDFDLILIKFDLCKTFRISAWMKQKIRSTNNRRICKSEKILH